jgi:outer membrane protein OmpA-like peptidoglycan-associated protein
MKYTSIILSLLVLSFQSMAQENKLDNGSFEELEKKVKSLGQFENAVNWYIPEGCEPADIFSAAVKKGDITAPDNVKGRADSKTGDNYIGIRAYSEREAKPRMFVQTKMLKKLLPGKKYCIKMHIQLSDLSKYAIGNVGMYISSKAIKLKDIENYDITPQLMAPGGAIIKQQDDWVEICKVFKAEGTERYVTLGNFAAQSTIKPAKMKRPREYTQPQSRDAYYFIDDVSIIPVDLMDGDCSCILPSDDDGPELSVVYTRNVSDDHEGTDQEKIELTVLHFATGQSALDEDANSDLGAIAEILKQNPSLYVDVIGYIDSKETPSVAEARARKVFAQLTSVLGVDASRVSYRSEGAENPVADNVTAEGRAQNRRVEFKVK